MAIIAKEGEGSKFPPNPQGVHHAVCYAVYDVGTQFNETFGKWQRKVVVCWELPNARIEVEDKEGNKRYSIEINCDNFLFLDNNRTKEEE